MTGATSGCSDNAGPEIAPLPDGGGGDGGNRIDGGGGTGAAVDSGSDAAVDDSGTTQTAKLLVGVIPTPTADNVSPEGETLAQLDVLSAGARGVALQRRWSDLFETLQLPGSPVWESLAQTAELFRVSGRSVLFGIGLTSGIDDAIPEQRVAWESDQAVQGVRRAVDKAYATFGEELVYLVFGREVDLYVNAAASAQRKAFQDFVAKAVSYAQGHPNKPVTTRVGVSLNAKAVTEGSALTSSLAQLGDVTVVTYRALDKDYRAVPPSAPAGDLDRISQAVSTDAGARAVVLEEIAYPSSEETGSTVEKQATFYDSLFQALKSRRDRFPFASVLGLNEYAPTMCPAIAATWGANGNDAAGAAACSIGLKSSEGEAKPAWGTVVAGMATFFNP